MLFLLAFLLSSGVVWGINCFPELSGCPDGYYVRQYDDDGDGTTDRCFCFMCQSGYQCADDIRTSCECLPGQASVTSKSSTCNCESCPAGHSCEGGPAQPQRCHCEFGTASTATDSDTCDCDNCSKDQLCVGGVAQPLLEVEVAEQFFHPIASYTFRGDLIDRAGTHHGSTSSPVFDGPGGALHMSNNEDIKLANFESVQLSPLTYSFWLQLSEGGHFRLSRSHAYTCSYAPYLNLLALNGYVRHGCGDANKKFYPELTTDVWNHIAIAYDADAAQMKSYFNGVEVLSASSVNLGTWRLGMGIAGREAYIKYLDVYDRSLSGSTINNIYNKMVPILQLEDDIEALTAQLETANGKTAKLESDIEALTAQLETANGKTAKLESELETANGKTAKLESDIEALIALVSEFRSGIKSQCFLN